MRLAWLIQNAIGGLRPIQVGVVRSRQNQKQIFRRRVVQYSHGLRAVGAQ